MFWIFVTIASVNLRTRVNYFSVIDQNNQINCLLHFHPYFTFEFLHSAVMISYQNSSSQCINFKRRGLVWKSDAILFSLQCKNHPVLEIQTQKMSRKLNWITKKIILFFFFFFFLFRLENHTLYLCCRSYLKNVNWTWKLQSDFHDFIKFSAKRQLLLLHIVINTSATSPSYDDVKTFEIK